jgi:hypothetical protein
MLKTRPLETGTRFVRGWHHRGKNTAAQQSRKGQAMWFVNLYNRETGESYGVYASFQPHEQAEALEFVRNHEMGFRRAGQFATVTWSDV